MQIRQLVNKIRIKRGVTAKQLGRAVGLSENNLLNWELGTHELSFNMIMAICEHLKIKLCAEHKVGYDWKRILLKR